MSGFLTDRRGNVAIIFGIGLIPILGFVGAVLDYSRAADLRSFLQTKSDATALNAAVNGQLTDHSKLLADLEAEIKNNYRAVTALSVSGTWVSLTHFRVEAKATVDTAMVHILPGVDRGIAVGIRAVAEVMPEVVSYEAPEKFDLEPDAGDYNQLFAYCFQFDKPGDPTARRKQMTLIADNDGNAYDFAWPKCSEGEALSFRMRNVRHARAYPQLWNNPNQWPYRAEYDFYTDTRLVGGAEQHTIRREVAWIPPQWQPYHSGGKFSPGTFDVLETVRCDSLEECVGKSQGGILPEGKNRNPNIETRPCEPGKYMYYGWEDRPPNQPGPSAKWTEPAWTDRSYDDIRIVMKCPVTGLLNNRLVRLVE
jgi:hypothetical protein